MENIVISESLKEKLAAAETLEEVVKACAEEGVEVTKEQLDAAVASENTELNAEDLDSVTGGAAVHVIAGAVAIYKFWRLVRKVTH